MINYADYIQSFTTLFPDLSNELPWKIALIAAAAVLLSATIVALAIIIQSDVAGRSAATVAQYAACITDGAAQLSQSASTLPSCSAVRLADISPIFMAVEALYQVPGCMPLASACPEFLFPIAN